jgi:phage-related protein
MLYQCCINHDSSDWKVITYQNRTVTAKITDFVQLHSAKALALSVL